MATTVRGIRVREELWRAAQAVAAARGETVTDAVTRALTEYVQQHATAVTEPSAGLGGR